MALRKISVAEMRAMVAASTKASKARTLTGKGAKLKLSSAVVFPAKHHLNPCPFCRSKNVVLDGGVTYPYVRCHDCCAHGPYIYYRISTDKKPELEEVCRLWNQAKQ